MMYRQNADVLALEQVLAGRPSALLDLYDRHAPAIFSWVYQVIGDRNEAEDVVQETFMTAWFDAPSWAATRREVVEWLMEIARERLALRHATGSASSVPPGLAALPRTLRDRVLDSIYGAGDRLRPPYQAPQWALYVSGRWVVWLLAAAVLALILILA
jgi:DNA-directed RNA polymerase specialized sigma24 family protein